MDRLPYDNAALFGADPKEAVVAVEVVADDRVRLFVRGPRGVATEDDGFTPFLFLESPALLEGWGGPARFVPLAGAWDY
ncbi:MAG: hypothetical protein AB1578_18405, partial [Thermodesulfobacteriota bacterium]